MMPIETSAGTAYAAMLAGIAIGYAELLRPGTILPGVGGAVVAMLGLAALVPHVEEPRALVLIAAGLGVVLADVLWGLRGAGAVAGAMAVSAGMRWLVAAKMGWAVAIGASVPFLMLTWWLGSMALRARVWKTAI